VIRDIRDVKLTLYMERVSTFPVYRGSFGGTVRSDSPLEGTYRLRWS